MNSKYDLLTAELISSIACSMHADDFSISKFIDPASLDIKIKIEGSRWDGKYDYRIAEFTTALQREILSLYNDICGTNINLASLNNDKYSFLIIHVVVDNGCTEIFAKISDAIDNIPIEALNQMESLHILIAFVVWSLVSETGKAYREQKKYKQEEVIKELETKAELAKVEKEKEQMAAVTEITRQAFAFAEKSQPPFAYIASQMGKEDTLTIGGHKMTKAEALEQFKDTEKQRPTEPIVETYYIDGNYKISGALNEDHKFIIRSEVLGRKHVSTSLLSDDDKIKIYDLLAAGDIAKYTPELGLLVNSEITDGKVTAINVVGLGEPRPSAVDLQKALNKSRIAAEERAVRGGLVQRSFFDE